MPITILQVAESRGVEESKDGSISMAAFHKVGLEMFGGCCLCEASIAAYNAYPSRAGFWKCGDCIDDDGYETTEDFNASELDAEIGD